LKDAKRGADEPGIVAEFGQADLGRVAEHLRSEFTDRLFDGGQQRVSGVGHSTGEDDSLRVQDVLDVDAGDCEVAACLQPGFAREGIAFRGGILDILALQLAAGFEDGLQRRFAALYE
jgi:hypothetical protein